MMSERQWYASKEHFDTEESYDEYKARKKKQKKKFLMPLLKYPKFKWKYPK